MTNKPGARLRSKAPKQQSTCGSRARAWFQHRLRPAGGNEFVIEHADGVRFKRCHSYGAVLAFMEKPDAERDWSKRKNPKKG